MREKKTYPFVVLDETTLTNGIRVLVDGVDTVQFAKNPVALYLHNDWSMPIGTWANIRKEDGKLLADFVPDYEDDDKEVQRLIGKVDRGVIKMASVGLVELKVADQVAGITEVEDTVTVTGCRLREISIVPIGRNHNALRLYDGEGKELDLSDVSLDLSDYIIKGNNNKKRTKMKKETLTILNLSDEATDEMIDAAVQQLNEEKEQALAEKTSAEAKAQASQAKLDAIDAARAEARKTEAISLVDAALKDGRLSEKEDGSIRKKWLELFDGNHEDVKALLESLPKRVSPSGTLELGDGGDPVVRKESEWDKRKKEIEKK